MKYGPAVKKWAFDELGKPRGIRALIASLPSILWEGSEWQEISVAKMVSNAQVKRAYFSAIRVVAPDKNQEQAYHIQYLSNRIYNYLNDAWKLHTNPPS